MVLASLSGQSYHIVTNTSRLSGLSHLDYFNKIDNFTLIYQDFSSDTDLNMTAASNSDEFLNRFVIKFLILKLLNTKAL